MWVKNSPLPTSCSLRHPWICDEHLARLLHMSSRLSLHAWATLRPADTPQTQFYSCDQWPNSYRIPHARVGQHTTHILTGLMVLLNELVISRFYCHDYAIKDIRKWTVFSLIDIDTLETLVSLILDKKTYRTEGVKYVWAIKWDWLSQRGQLSERAWKVP